MIVFLYSILTIEVVTAQEVTNEAGKKKKIDITNFDTGLREANLFKAIGNVVVKHNDAVMWCDSAYLYEKSNQVTAFSRVRIEQGDTLKLFGDYLFYDGNTEKAFVTGDVRLIDKETTLYTDALNYNLADRVAYYNTNGKIINNDDTLRSIKGTYYSHDKMFHFSDSVRITGPDYFITADTMHYQTESEVTIAKSQPFPAVAATAADAGPHDRRPANAVLRSGIVRGSLPGGRIASPQAQSRPAKPEGPAGG